MNLSYHKKSLNALFVGILVFAAGCLGGTPEGAVEPPTELIVVATEFKFDLSTGTVSSGEITIAVRNDGAISHEFMVYKPEDIDEVLAMHAADHEEGAMEMGMMGGPVIAEIKEDDLPPGDTQTIKITLEPGVYELGCHVPGHYEGGMKATLNVV